MGSDMKRLATGYDTMRNIQSRMTDTFSRQTNTQSWKSAYDKNIQITPKCLYLLLKCPPGASSVTDSERKGVTGKQIYRLLFTALSSKTQLH